MADDQNGRIAGTTMPDVDKVFTRTRCANFRATLICGISKYFSAYRGRNLRPLKQQFNALNKFKMRYRRHFGATRCLRELRA